MDRNAKNMWRIKDILFVMLFILGIVSFLYIFCDYNITSQQDLPDAFYVVIVMYIISLSIIFYYTDVKYYIKQAMNKYLVPQSASKYFPNKDITQKLNIDDGYDEKNAKILTTLKKENILEDEKNDKYDNIYSLIESNKNDLAIEQCTKELEVSAKKEKLLLLVLRYFACIHSDKEMYNQYLENDIKLILKFEEKFNEEVKKKIYRDSDLMQKLFISCRSNLVVLYYKQHKYEEMHKENKILINLIMNNPKVDNSIKAKSLQLRAMYHLSRKQTAYAIGYFNEALNYVKNEYYLLYNMYILYFHEYNNLPKSIEILQRILYLDDISEEHYENTINSLAYILSLQGRYDEAYEYLECFCTKYTPDERTLANKCYLANKLQKHDEAKQLISKITDKIPSDVSCLKIKSIYQIEDGEYEYAIQNLSEAIRQFKDIEKEQKNHFFTGEAYYYRAIAYLQKGNKKLAHQDFDNAIKCGFYDFDSQYIVDFDLDNEDIRQVIDDHDKSQE